MIIKNDNEIVESCVVERLVHFHFYGTDNGTFCVRGDTAKGTVVGREMSLDQAKELSYALNSAILEAENAV